MQINDVMCKHCFWMIKGQYEIQTREEGICSFVGLRATALLPTAPHKATTTCFLQTLFRLYPVSLSSWNMPL